MARSAFAVGPNGGAKLGSVPVTEPIGAMEVSPVGPLEYLVGTGTSVIAPLLSARMVHCWLHGLSGSVLNAHKNEATSLGAFLRSRFASIGLDDVGASGARSFVYGLLIGSISCYKRFNVTAGSHISRNAPVKTAVTASWAIGS